MSCVWTGDNGLLPLPSSDCWKDMADDTDVPYSSLPAVKLICGVDDAEEVLGLSLAVPVPMGTATGVPTGRGAWVGVVGRE